jgi:Ca-activated chloride channel family protein
MSFLAAPLLLLLVTVPLAGLAFVLLQRRRTAEQAAGPLGTFTDEAGSTLGRRRFLPFLLFLGGLTLLLIGLARPEADIDLPRVEGTAILAFDVSNSMLATDLEPTRMDAAKAAAHLFVDNQPSTVRVGIVTFNDGGNITQTPTGNKAALHAAIDRLRPDGGTSLPQGIFSSLNAISGAPLPIPEGGLEDVGSADIGYFGSGVIVLLSDGEQTEEIDAAAVTQLAANAGVRVFTVGIGSVDGTVVELDGFNLSTSLDEEPLQDIANATDGQYFRATSDADLTEIYDTIDLELTVRGETVEITSLFAAAGAILLLAGAMVSMRLFGRMP